jgi:hypothetical protein
MRLSVSFEDITALHFNHRSCHSKLQQQYFDGCDILGVRESHTARHSGLLYKLSKLEFSVSLSVYGSTALCWTLAAFSDSWSFYTVGKNPWTGDQPVARPLPTHRTAQTQSKLTPTFMPQVGFEPTIPVFQRAKTVHALDCGADFRQQETAAGVPRGCIVPSVSKRCSRDTWNSSRHVRCRHFIHATEKHNFAFSANWNAAALQWIRVVSEET